MSISAQFFVWIRRTLSSHALGILLLLVFAAFVMMRLDARSALVSTDPGSRGGAGDSSLPLSTASCAECPDCRDAIKKARVRERRRCEEKVKKEASKCAKKEETKSEPSPPLSPASSSSPPGSSPPPSVETVASSPDASGPRSSPLPTIDAQNVDLVFGMVTVSRPSENYIGKTLLSLFSHMSATELSRIRIFVLDADIPSPSSLSPGKRPIDDAISSSVALKSMLDSGYLVLERLEDQYPQLQPDARPLKKNFGDSIERIRWRSKQVLDFAEIMQRVRRKFPFAPYYVHLEDDVIASYGFVSKIRSRMGLISSPPPSSPTGPPSPSIPSPVSSPPNSQSTVLPSDWFMISFYSSQMILNPFSRIPPDQFFGFIGQLFRMSDLDSIIQYFVKNFDERPSDWLMRDFIAALRPTRTIYVHSPSLFQHVGKMSSLVGKKQPISSPTFRE